MQNDTPILQPVQAPQQAPNPPITTTPPTGSKTLAVVSLVAGILAIVTGVIFFVSIIIAIAGLTTGIIALVKHKAGKRMAIAGVVTSGVAILALPINYALFYFVLMPVPNI